MADLEFAPPLRKAERPFGVQNILTLGAGPCTVSPRVLQALSAQIIQTLNMTHAKVRINYNLLGSRTLRKLQKYRI